jgi:PilZ domain
VKPQPNAKPAATHRVVPTRSPTAEERRRAQRVLLRIKVVVQVVGKANSCEGHTHTVSASGAMLVIPEPLAEGTEVIVQNPKTQNTVEARVVRPPQTTHEGSLVPVEFTSPSPNFWGIFFPPAVN